MCLADSFRKLGIKDSALFYFKQAESLLANTASVSSRYHIYRSLGELNQETFNPMSAKEYYHRTLSLPSLNANDSIPILYHLLGIYYYEQKEDSMTWCYNSSPSYTFSTLDSIGKNYYFSLMFVYSNELWGFNWEATHEHAIRAMKCASWATAAADASMISRLQDKNGNLQITDSICAMVDEIGKIPLLWLQDLEGNMLQEVSSVGWRHRLAFEYYLWNRAENVTFCTSNADTLYHYNLKENRLVPRFTIHCLQERGPHVSMEDVSDYYMFMFAESVPNDFGYWYLPQKRIIVDKKTLKGAYVDIVLDGYGEMRITDKWFRLNGDYMMMILQPKEVMAMCKEVLAREESIPSDEAKRVRDLLRGIHEDDNSFVLYGKIK